MWSSHVLLSSKYLCRHILSTLTTVVAPDEIWVGVHWDPSRRSLARRVDGAASVSRSCKETHTETTSLKCTLKASIEVKWDDSKSKRCGNELAIQWRRVHQKWFSTEGENHRHVHSTEQERYSQEIGATMAGSTSVSLTKWVYHFENALERLKYCTWGGSGTFSLSPIHWDTPLRHTWESRAGGVRGGRKGVSQEIPPGARNTGNKAAENGTPKWPWATQTQFKSDLRGKGGRWTQVRNVTMNLKKQKVHRGGGTPFCRNFV